MEKLLGLIGIVFVTCAFSYEFPKHQLRGMDIMFMDVTEADIAVLAYEWKANQVRLMGHQYDIEPNMGRLYEIVNWCRKYNLYCVVSLVPNSTWSNDFGGFWTDSAMQNNYTQYCKTVWKPLAATDDGIALDIFNEPWACTAQQWVTYSRTLTKAIREIDQVHPLVVEAHEYACLESFYANGQNNFKPTGDVNTVYSFHQYAPYNYTTQVQGFPVQYTAGYADQIKRRLQYAVDSFAVKYNVRLWCGEFGAAWWAPEAVRFLEDNINAYEAKGIGWCSYAFREKAWQVMNYENNPEIVAMFKRRMVMPATGLSNRSEYKLNGKPGPKSLVVYDVLGRSLWNRGNQHIPSRAMPGRGNSFLLSKDAVRVSPARKAK